MIEDGATHAPAQERLNRLQGLVGSNWSPALFDRRDDLNYISFADLVNALASPGLSDFSAKKPCDLAGGAVLGQTLRDEAFQQILHAIRHHSPLRLPLLGRRIPAFQLSCEHLLCSHTCLMKRHAPVWPNGVFAQLRTSAGGAVEHDKHLATLRRDLNAEAGKAGVPVDQVGRGVGSASMELLVNLMRGMECSYQAVLPSRHIGSTANEMTGSNVLLDPNWRKENQCVMNHQQSTSISGKRHTENQWGEGAEHRRCEAGEGGPTSQVCTV